VFWLGRALDQAGYASLPAKSVSDSMRLLDELQVSPDLVVLNYALPGASELIASLRRESKALKVIALVKDGNAPIAPMVDWQINRPAMLDESSRLHLREEISRILPRPNGLHDTAFLTGRGQHF